MLALKPICTNTRMHSRRILMLLVKTKQPLTPEKTPTRKLYK